jgi:GNS1/SUR4 family
MYTYYTCSTIGIRLPSAFKRALTTLQITQFVVGGSLAASYLFVHLPKLPSAAPPPSASTHSAIASSFSVLSDSNGIINECLSVFIIHTSIRLDPLKTFLVAFCLSCRTTNGMRFAVWLNVAYLTPLSQSLLPDCHKLWKLTLAAPYCVCSVPLCGLLPSFVREKAFDLSRNEVIPRRCWFEEGPEGGDFEEGRLA